MSTLFADKIYTATDLNRRSGELLQTASAHPITVTGSTGGPVVIQSRDRAAALEFSSFWLPRLSALVDFVTTGGGDLPDDLAWVADLTTDNRTVLIKELVAHFREPLNFDNAQAIEDFLYEWEVTAEADADPELRTNLLSAMDDVSKRTVAV